MNEFAVVSEGVTDYQVLRNVLTGWFKGQSGEPFLKPYQPDPDADGRSTWHFGGWENVLRYLREKKHRDALEFADHLIIQIDTDQSGHPNFQIPHNENGMVLDPLVVVQRTADMLRNLIGEEDTRFYGDRILFAICVREIECWLLPLWDAARANKCEGCLDTLNRALSRQNERAISSDRKEPRLYELYSKGYRKRKALLEKGVKNPSLKIFIGELERRNIQLAPPGTEA